MQIHIKRLTDSSLMRRACEMTLRPGMSSNVKPAAMYRCEHSPIRTQMFWVELIGVQTFVSVHLVRHKHGVEHFVMSNRDDRGGAGDGVVTRESPVNHGMLINAQALIQMSRKRLCYASHTRTIAVWSRLRKYIRGEDAALAEAMVPECVYRNGLCPELRECRPGVAKVCAAYGLKPSHKSATGE